MRLKRWFILSVALNALMAFPLAAYFPDALDSLFREDQLVENLTALFFFAVFVMGAVYVPVVKGRRSRALMIAVMSVGLAGGLDEISFGRRFFIRYSEISLQGIKIDGLHDIVEVIWRIMRRYLGVGQWGFAVLLGVIMVGAAGVLFFLLKSTRQKSNSEQEVSIPMSLLLAFVLLLGMSFIADLELIYVGQFAKFVEESLELQSGIALFLCSVAIASEAVRLRFGEKGVQYTGGGNVSGQPFPQVFWLRISPTVLAVLLFGATLFVLYDASFRKADRLKHYWAVKRALLSVPRDATLLTSEWLASLSPARKRVVTWNKYDPVARPADLILGELSSMDVVHQAVLLDAVEKGGFSDRFFDGDLFLLERNGKAEINPYLYRALKNCSNLIRLSCTYHHAGELRYLRSGGCVWHWKGNTQGGPVTLCYGMHRSLGPGHYVAILSYRGIEPVEASGQPWGVFGIYRKGAREPIREVELEKQTVPEGQLAHQVLEFELAETVTIEPRVGGVHAELWLQQVLFEEVQPAVSTLSGANTP